MTRRYRMSALLAALVALAFYTYQTAQGAAQTATRARAARTISLQESTALRLTRNSVSIHEAEGQASGTINGRLALRIDVETASRMSAIFLGRAGSSTLGGSGSASYTVSGSTLHFKGTAKITRGSGSYAHASGSGIQIEGTLNRQKSTITMTIRGRITT